VARKAEESENIPFLYAVSTSVTFLPVALADDTAPRAEEPAAAARESSAQTLRRERRTYRGAIYEKGEDGQWHLLHE
jgi:hypothetical protein